MHAQPGCQGSVQAPFHTPKRLQVQACSGEALQSLRSGACASNQILRFVFIPADKPHVLFTDHTVFFAAASEAHGTITCVSCAHTAKFIVLACRGPLQRCLVEHAHAVHNQRGLPLLVPYSWNVRNLQAHAYACGVCRAVGTDRHQLSVQRAEISHFLALDKNMVAAALRCRDAWWNLFMPFTTNEANHCGFLIRGTCEASPTDRHHLCVQERA